jgi:hypothetical protein
MLFVLREKDKCRDHKEEDADDRARALTREIIKDKKRTNKHFKELVELLLHHCSRWIKSSKGVSIANLVIVSMCLIEHEGKDQEYTRCTCEGDVLEKTLLMLQSRTRNGQWSCFQRKLQLELTDQAHLIDFYPPKEDESDDEDNKDGDYVMMETNVGVCDGTIHTAWQDMDPCHVFTLMQRVILYELDRSSPLYGQVCCYLGAELVTRILFNTYEEDFEEDQARMKHYPSQYPDIEYIETNPNYKTTIHEWVVSEMGLQPSDTFEHNFRHDFYFSCAPIGSFSYACRGNRDEANAVALMQDTVDEHAHLVHSAIESDLHLGMDEKVDTHGMEKTGKQNWIGPGLLYQRDQLLILHTFANFITDRYECDFMHEYIIQLHQAIGPPDKKRQEAEELHDDFDSSDEKEEVEQKPILGSSGLNRLNLILERNIDKSWIPPRPVIVELATKNGEFNWFVVVFHNPGHEDVGETEQMYEYITYGAHDTEEVIFIWLTIMHQQFECILHNDRNITPVFEMLLLQ